MEEKRSYYAIIPATVRYDNSIPSGAKLLYGEISALCNDKGFCWASNSYFASLYGNANVTISRWISALKEGGYITVSFTVPTQENPSSERCIALSEMINPLIKNDKPPYQKCKGGYIKNDKHNNTVNNTVNITPYNPPRGNDAKTTVKQRFDIFWKAYPRKVGKGAAERSFVRSKIDDKLLQTILQAIETQKRSVDWTKENGEYIPHPATWLNQRRWEDELPIRDDETLPTSPPRKKYITKIDENGDEYAEEVT